MQINVISTPDGYVENYAIVGSTGGSIVTATISDSQIDYFVTHHAAYRLENGALVLDEDKLAAEQAAAEQAALTARYIPSEAQSAAAVGQMVLAQMANLDDDARIRVSGLYGPWSAGQFEVGDIRNSGGQTWACFQAHDNATYPDIKPGSAAWFTFWRPLHGKSPETARPFAPVQGAHDMYKIGEYAVFEDALYKCVQDTAYSPADYPQAWEKLN
ncbi:hypothetical protein [Ruthenibacterium lactatiformans]|uniref:hypothetical protein n=1 Tax=Ruthenibacterium lactatiformans TaxID=1550024 RepID=UPI0026736CB6|nr:hypothetical protein [Ruthenibacterium lactatiformans]